jgi:hypothetical protein
MQASSILHSSTGFLACWSAQVGHGLMRRIPKFMHTKRLMCLFMHCATTDASSRIPNPMQAITINESTDGILLCFIAFILRVCLGPADGRWRWGLLSRTLADETCNRFMHTTRPSPSAFMAALACQTKHTASETNQPVTSAITRQPWPLRHCTPTAHMCTVTVDHGPSIINTNLNAHVCKSSI